MSTIAVLPTGWRQILAGDPEMATCAQLLTNAHKESKAVSAAKLNTLLGKTYYEPLDKSYLPVFMLYGYRAPSSAATTIVVAFHKTIKRTDGAVPTGPGASQSKPTRRWCCITEGVEDLPATGWSYTQVYAICSWFFDNMLNRYDLLVTVDDYSRVSDPTRFNPANWEVDAASALLTADSTVTKFNPTTLAVGSQDVEASYPPFTGALSAAGKSPQLVFTGLTPAG